jgi:hypothetical protein
MRRLGDCTLVASQVLQMLCANPTPSLNPPIAFAARLSPAKATKPPFKVTSLSSTCTVMPVLRIAGNEVVQK